MRFVSKVVLASASVAFSSMLHATPWINTDDQFLQQSIQLLSNSGHLNIPVNTWPLMWQPVMEQLQQVNTQNLSSAELFAYLRVKSAASYAQRSTIKTASLQASSDPLATASFGNQFGEKAAATLSYESKHENWASGLVKSIRRDSYDATAKSQNKTNWDGSYGAYIAGNWVLVASVQQQWWGPAITSSFSFNNQQRPTKSLQINRLNSNLPLHQHLKWLGPVNVNLQLGEYAGTAPTRHARYTAARVSLRPIKPLELGVTGRQLKPQLSEQITTGLYSDLLPQDNITTLGLDARYNLTAQAAVYGELSAQRGEQQTNGWLLGSHYYVGNQDILLRFFAEYQHIPENYAQWLFIQPGAIGAPYEKQWVAGVQISAANGQSGYLKFSNRTSQQKVLTQTSQLIDATLVNVGYQHPIFSGLASIDYELQRGQQHNENVFEHAVGAKMEWRW